MADKIVYTGALDELFDCRFGRLEYRSLQFEHERKEMPNFQGNAVVNYTEARFPFTRIIEHKHFEFGDQKHTVITKEYPAEYKHANGSEPYYPVNDHKNNVLYEQYRKAAECHTNLIVGGRLAKFRYYDMHQVIASALKTVQQEIQNNI
jgi:UDP-galactopyranose mutase